MLHETKLHEEEAAFLFREKSVDVRRYLHTLP